MVFSKLFHRTPTAGTVNGFESHERHSSPEVPIDEKGPVEETNTTLHTYDGEESIYAQDGVKKAQATTIVWTKKALIVAYFL